MDRDMDSAYEEALEAAEAAGEPWFSFTEFLAAASRHEAALAPTVPAPPAVSRNEAHARGVVALIDRAWGRDPADQDDICF